LGFLEDLERRLLKGNKGSSDTRGLVEELGKGKRKKIWATKRNPAGFSRRGSTLFQKTNVKSANVKTWEYGVNQKFLSKLGIFQIKGRKTNAGKASGKAPGRNSFSQLQNSIENNRGKERLSRIFLDRGEGYNLSWSK